MGMVDNRLFTKKKSSNLIIVQIYVDDIIFGSTCQDMCDEFDKFMHDEFEMSMMGELNFFLGLQIKQMEDGIFFNQSKYIKEMLKKFGLEESKPIKTPMSFDTKLTKDEECESVNSTKYRGMIGSLLYLMASRPDIMFSVCLCARFQEAPKTSHLEAVKRIFRYIKGTTHLGLWYPKGTGIETVVYADSDHAGDLCVDIAKISRKRLKPGKHEHGNGRARKEPGESYQKSRMVNSSQKSRGKSQLDTGKANSSDKNHSGRLCDQAYENSLIYKEKTKKLHDSKIKNRIFNVGDRVLLFNSRLKIFSGKLKTRWSGPFTITKVFPYRTIELSQPDGPNFKGKTSPSTLIGGDPRKNDTVDIKEAQGNRAYTLEVHTKEAQRLLTHGCHAGNPCALQSNPTAQIELPMIVND
ncbi:retrovirus-related pol polyprotein from transposon TNT 1-94 [Tanacetum coccineum]